MPARPTTTKAPVLAPVQVVPATPKARVKKTAAEVAKLGAEMAPVQTFKS